MAISEIEKLERRYQENPQGLTFAPLAEAYRKSGDPERALARLAPGLELHPDYIPASIVQGRCHLDMGNDPAAEASFAHVLALDPENVIALKALADITERGARFEDAERWLVQLLTVDRSNDEAEGQLARVRDSRSQQVSAAEGASAEGAAEAMPESVAIDGLEQAEEATPSFVLDVADELPSLSTVERETETAGSAPEALQSVDALEPTALPADLPPIADLEPAAGFMGSSFGESVPAASPDDPSFGVTQLGGGDEIVLNAAGASEYQLPSASEDFKPKVDEDAPPSEFQLPSASEQLGGAGMLDTTGSAAASEYQLPSVSDDFAASVRPAEVSEFQLPDASRDFDSTLLSGSGSETNEFQSADGASALLGDAATPPEPVTEEPVPAPVAEASPVTEVSPVVDEPAGDPPVDEEPAGQWTTWSDAALDPDAEPFPEDTPAADERVHVAAAALEVTETFAVLEVVSPEPGEEREPAGDAVAEPAMVVTESMAELFVMQGHHADALRIYRELAAARGGDVRLEDRISELEALVAAAPQAPLPRYAASHSGGTSVREMMRSVLTSRPNGPQAAPAAEPPHGDTPGTPTRPAPDHLTLSAIFGDDAAPLPPAMRAAHPAPATPDKGVSFDEFYAAGAGTATSRRERTTRIANQDDDLDQFHDWLQNLKR